MTRTLTGVTTFPQPTDVGYPDRRSDDDEAFLRAAAPLAHLYEEVLAGAGLVGRCSTLVVNLHGAPDAVPDVVLVEIDTEARAASGEMARVAVPPGFAALPPPVRSWTVLGVLDATLRLLCGRHGWDRGVADDARDHAVAAAFTYRHAGDWRPDRRGEHEARLAFRVLPDGSSWMRLEVRDRAGTVQATGTPVPLVWLHTAVPLARRLHWRGDEVSVRGESPPVVLHVGDGHTPAPAFAAVRSVRGGDPLEVRASWRSEDAAAEVLVHVVGRQVGTSATYDRALDSLEQVLTGPWFRRWWSDADRPRLEIVLDQPDDQPPGTRSRRLRAALGVTVHRDPATLDGGPGDADLARADLTAALERAAEVMGLPAPPALPVPSRTSLALPGPDDDAGADPEETVDRVLRALRRRPELQPLAPVLDELARMTPGPGRTATLVAVVDGSGVALDPRLQSLLAVLWAARGW